MRPTILGKFRTDQKKNSETARTQKKKNHKSVKMAHPVEYSCQPDNLHSDDDLNSYGHSESVPFTQKSKEIRSDEGSYYHDSHGSRTIPVSVSLREK